MTTNKQSAEKARQELCAEAIRKAIQTLRDAKPSDKSELDRRFAITITEAEKVYAYFYTWILKGD